jgi:hypothetical protein
MPNKSLAYLSKLPNRYRSAARSSPGWDDWHNDVPSSRSFSWRTFSTSSAPSELLSFYRNVHMYTIGRVLNRFGTIIANPIDNIMARRELKNVLEYTQNLETDDDWATAKSIFQSEEVIKGLLEAGRWVKATSL